MATKTALINELELRHGTSPEILELRRRYGDGNNLYQNIKNKTDVPAIANDVFDMSTEFGVPTFDIEPYYPAIIDNDPKSITFPTPDEEPVHELEFQPLQWQAEPDRSAWFKFKNFFKGQGTQLPPDADRMEKVEQALDIAVSGPLRTLYKFANGRLFGAGDLLWAGLKRMTPKDIWDEEVKDMNLDEAMDWAMGYEPSGFTKMVGEVAEFTGRIGSAQKIGIRTGILGKTPKDISAIIKAAEAGKLFGIASAINEISKLAVTKIDPTEAEYGFEGPKAVGRDIAIGALFSFAMSGLKGAWAKITPNERSRALKVLGLKKNATDAEIKSATRVLARKFHPDKVKGFREDFEAVIKARDVLKGDKTADVIFRGQKVTYKPRLLPGEVKPVTALAKAPTVAPVDKAPAEGKIVPKPPAKPELFEKSDLLTAPNIPDSAVTAERQPGGKFKLMFTGTSNEVFQGELFNSAREARGVFKAQKLKAQQAAKLPKPPPQEPRLPGGREAGATTIIPDVTTEISETSKKLGSTAKSVVDAGKKLYSRNVLRYSTDLKRLGNVGKEVSNDLDEITQRAQVRINNSSADAKAIFKGVKKANRERIARTVNGIEKNPPKWIKDRAEQLRTVLDELLTEAQNLGVQRLVKGVKLDVTGTSKAFPQIPNADGDRFLKLADAQGTGSPVVLDAAERAVAAGKVKSVEEYVTQLKEFRRAQLRGISGYLERTRVQLPEQFVEWDPDRILSGLFQTNWTFLEGARQWGVDSKGQSFPKLDVKIEGSPDFTGDDKQILERFIKAAFGQELLSSESARTISATVRGYQFLTKIAPSPLTILRNMMDRFAKVSAWSPLSVQAKTFIQYPPFINSWFKHSRELEEEMIRRGAVFSNAAIAEGYQPGKLFTTLAAKPFTSSELGNQVYIAIAKRNAIDANLKILKQNPKIAAFFDKKMGKFLSPLEAIGKAPSQAAARLRELGNDELLAKLESSKDISPDLLNTILHRTVRDNAFPVVLSTKRVWWDNHPFMRVLTQFKIWGTEQIGHIWNDVIKKTVQNRDPSLLIRWLTTMAVMGEIYNIVRDFALNKNESLLKNLSAKDKRNVKDISITILKDIVDGGGVGIFADLMYGLPNLIGGPTAATIKNALTKTGESILNPSQFLDATKEEFFKESPALNQARGIMDKIDAQSNRDNLTQEYSAIRQRAFEWRFNKENPGQIAKAKALAIKALFGWVQRVPSPRSLGLEMMNRQVLVGDIEDASEHIFFLFKQGGTDDEKFVSTSEAIRTSFNNNSPLGPVAAKDIDEFFSSMDSKQRREAVRLQARWERNAAEATEKGIDKWEKWIRTQ